MKAVLTFNLPEESEEHLTALNGWRYKLVLEQLDNNLRSLIKYENKETILIQDVRDTICMILNDYGIKMHE